MPSAILVVLLLIVGCALACPPPTTKPPTSNPGPMYTAIAKDSAKTLTKAPTKAPTQTPTATPTTTPVPPGMGRKRRAAGDVVIVFRTNEVFQAGKNAEHLRDVKQKLSAFARTNNVDPSLLKPTVQNVLGRFAARIELIGGFRYCQDVKRFVKGALYELPQVNDAKVKCGDALGVTISRN